MERTSGRYRESINVRAGETFRIPQDFTIDQALEQDGDVEDIGSLGLKIEGLDECDLVVSRTVDDGNWNIGIRTPLGNITTTQTRSDEDIIPDRNTLPLYVQFRLSGLSGDQLKGLTIEMKAGHQRFVGDVNDDLLDGGLKDGKFDVTIMDWIGDSGKPLQVWFPQDPDAQVLKDGLQFKLTFE